MTKNEKISASLKKRYAEGLKPNMKGAHSKESRKKQADKKKGRKLSDEHKKKISNGLSNSEKFQKAISNPTRNKRISDKLKGKIFTDEQKRKMSENHADISGDKNPSKRKDVKEKISKALKGRKFTDEWKAKIGITSRLRLIERLGKKFGTIKPFYNKTACKYFNWLMSVTNTNISHAENGGEFYISELGYWVDGYDVDNNIVYEWYEKHHYDRNGNILPKDLARQDAIQKTLRCVYIVIKAFPFKDE